MVLNIIVLAFATIVSIILPLIVLGVLICKCKEQWKETVIAFISGGLIFIVMQWGIKNHGLQWLINNTGFKDFMNYHYIPYLLVVAVIGAILVVMTQVFIVKVLFKKNVSFIKAVAFGVGYGMTESVLLLGLECISTITYLAQNPEMQLSTTRTDWLLSGYERILIMMIEIAIVVAMIYFIEHKMTVLGGVIAICCHTLTEFLPDFFIAFSLSDYYEVYDHTVALIFVYIFLTAAAITALVVLNAFKYQLND